MLAILGGMGAAIAFSAATLCNSRSSRMIGPAQLLAWIMLIGLVLTAPLVATDGVPEGLTADSVGWLAIAGVGNVVGLLLAYSALRLGSVGVVAPLISTQGAIAAVIAVVSGERLSLGAGAALVVIVVGVFLAGVVQGAVGEALDDRRAAIHAIAAAISIGWSVYAIGRVSLDLPVVWALVPSRAIGVLVVTAPLALTRRMSMTRRAFPLVLMSGVLEVVGFGLFALGARHGIAVSAVLSSQFAAIAAVAAYFLFHERLGLVRIVGVACVVTGVGVLSWLQS